MSTESLRRSLTRWLLRTVRADDPWRRYRYAVPIHRYGLGAQRDFGWYLEGESEVDVASVDEVAAWLGGCTYVRDADLFQEPDVWQHPRAFEMLRRGDCEDFSLWGWRKLVRLGYEAEFVAGRHGAAGHTWVLFRRDGVSFLLDATTRGAGEVVVPLEDVRHEYTPEVSVDHRLVRYAFAGYFLLSRGTSERAARYSAAPGALADGFDPLRRIRRRSP